MAASTQNQALNALVFLYDQVLQNPLGDLGEFARVTRPARLPEVLTQEETLRVLAALKPGTTRLIIRLLYGTGMRLIECLRLRVKDLDFARSRIVVREGKGDKDRVTMLPERLKGELQEHLERVELLHQRDLAEGFGQGVPAACTGAEISKCRQGMGLAMGVSLGTTAPRIPGRA